MRGWLRWGTLGLVVLWAATASADAVMGPRDDCPVGSIGRFGGHAGPFCAPHTCENDAGCAGFDGAAYLGGDGPYACRSAGVCVHDQTYTTGGRVMGQQTQQRTRQVVRGTCETDADCAVGTCEVADRCVPASSGASEDEAHETDEADDTGATESGDPAASSDPEAASTQPAEEEEAGDGGCRIARHPAGPGAWWLALAAAAGLWRRRRTR